VNEALLYVIHDSLQ